MCDFRSLSETEHLELNETCIIILFEKSVKSEITLKESFYLHKNDMVVVLINLHGIMFIIHDNF
jgi:hypothetical protein